MADLVSFYSIELAFSEKTGAWLYLCHLSIWSSLVRSFSGASV